MKEITLSDELFNKMKKQKLIERIELLAEFIFEMSESYKNQINFLKTAIVISGLANIVAIFVIINL